MVEYGLWFVDLKVFCSHEPTVNTRKLYKMRVRCTFRVSWWVDAGDGREVNGGVCSLPVELCLRCCIGNHGYFALATFVRCRYDSYLKNA